MKLHESINSVAVVLSLAIASYAAWTSREQERENLIGYAEVIDSNQIRLVDGCDTIKNHAPQRDARPWDGMSSVYNCGYMLESTRWRITISNQSRQPLAIVKMNFVVTQQPEGRYSYRDTIDSLTKQPGVSIPMNMGAYFSSVITITRFVPVHVSKDDFNICSVAVGTSEIRNCLAWRRNYKPPEMGAASEAIQAEFVSSSGQSYIVPLPDPLLW